MLILIIFYTCILIVFRFLTIKFIIIIKYLIFFNIKSVFICHFYDLFSISRKGTRHKLIQSCTLSQALTLIKAIYIYL